MNWPVVVSLIAALGSCGAAIAAVWIATSDRRQRNTERLDAAKAQAMLVLLDVRLSGSPAFVVYVRNFGAEAILNVEVDSARFARVPNAKFEVESLLGPTLKVVEPGGDREYLAVRFVDEQGDSVIRGSNDELGNFVPQNADPADLDVTIRFMDAHGHHWLRSLDSVKLAKRA